jgi:hypothetical protein
MSGPTQASFEGLSRANARACAQDGIAALARAFNHCGNSELAHRYTDAVQSRFLELAMDLVQLVESGEIESNPAHRLYLRAVAARGDESLQAMIRKASQKTPIRRSANSGDAR